MAEGTSDVGNARSSLWETVRAVAEEFGVELFDIDIPTGSQPSGVLRVYLSRANLTESAPAGDDSSMNESQGDRRTGVSFEDCVRVSKRLLDLDEQDGFIPEGCLLEVSSPGINRRLRLREHFVGAVGERVRVKFRTEEGAYRVVTGLLTAVNDDILLINDEQNKESVDVGVSSVKEARVDFKF